MSQKRHQEEEGSSFNGKRSRKIPSFHSVVQDAMFFHRLKQLAEPILEPLIRQVVKEEVDLAIRKHLISKDRNSGKSSHHPESTSLQFLSAISLPVFTGTRIEGEGCNALAVALFNMHTGEIVSSGPESSGKVEILVLEGDFDGDEDYNWTLEDFASNIVKEREGKKPLLTGDVIMALKDGVAPIEDISFTDNSSWTRSRKFRLGARFVENVAGVRIKEAKSEAFIVRDHRGELYKKHHPPYLSDEVWRLKKIGKDGAFHQRLRKERINTVQDFLVLLFLDPSRLRNILGTGMPAKMWETVVEHAQTCVLDNKLYLYDVSRSPQENGVVFNVVGQVMGKLSNGQYVSADNLSDPEKAVSRELVISAFRDWGNVSTFDSESSSNACISSPNPPQNQSSSTLQFEDAHYQDLITQRIGSGSCLIQNEPSSDFMQSVYSFGGFTSNMEYMHVVEPEGMMFDQDFCVPSQDAETIICNPDSAMTQAFRGDEPPQYAGTDYSSRSSDFEVSTDLHAAIQAFLPCSAVGFHASRRWNVLLSVLRWRILIRRIVATKKKLRYVP